jgi:hypothetical protein
MAFQGSEHLVYHKFQDQSYVVWVWEIFKYVIILITWNKFYLISKPYMLSNVTSVLFYAAVILWPSHISAKKICKKTPIYKPTPSTFLDMTNKQHLIRQNQTKFIQPLNTSIKKHNRY